MDNISDDTSDIDDIIDCVLNKFNDAIINHGELTTSGAINDIDHLITTLNLYNDPSSDDVTEIVNEVIENVESNQPFSNTPSNNTIDNQYDTLSNVDLKDKSTKSSARSFFSHLWTCKGNREQTISPMPSIPSVNSVNNHDDDNKPTSLIDAENEIINLTDQGPAGIVHLSPLSHVVNRRIQVWTSSMSLYHEAGRERSGEALNVQYHSSPVGIAGHWTLPDNKEPQEYEINLNDCLFNVIAEQIGRRPSELRVATVERMKKNIVSLAKRIEKLAHENKCGRIILMIGGARYTGKSASDAKRILDESQSGRCHPGHIPGHPRGHASNPEATKATESAENYSRDGWKTAFTSREDQNRMAHQALSTPIAQNAMTALNEGGESRSIHIPASQLSNLPSGVNVNDGVVGKHLPIKEIVMVLRHHYGHAKDPNHNVFVHTFYPKLQPETNQ